MPKITGKVLSVSADDEHFIRRLGRAVVWQWDELPPEVQKRIQEQAVFMHDDQDHSVHLNESLSVFIRKNKGPKDA